MTARPVDPDRTDAVARLFLEDRMRRGFYDTQALARVILTTDDPAAAAALLATLAERHPDQYLTAGRDAGVLREDRYRDALGRLFTRLASTPQQLTSDEALARLRERLSAEVEPE